MVPEARLPTQKPIMEMVKVTEVWERAQPNSPSSGPMKTDQA